MNIGKAKNMRYIELKFHLIMQNSHFATLQMKFTRKKGLFYLL